MYYYTRLCPVCNELNMLNNFELNFRYREIFCGYCSATEWSHRKAKFEIDTCLLCGKPEKIVKTPNGQAKNLNAAILCEDSNILDQIKSLNNMDNLSYLMDNKSFKSYILKKNVERIVKVTGYPFCSSCYNTSSAQIMRLKYILVHCVG